MRRHPFLVFFVTAVLVAGTVGGVWAFGQRERQRQNRTPPPTSSLPRPLPTPTIGTTAATPAVIGVHTPTVVTITSKISDSRLRSQHPLLLRVDASGNPLAILARLHDDGRNGDATARDRIYTAQVTLNESSTGQVFLRVAALFNHPPSRDSNDFDDDGDDRWGESESLPAQMGRDTSDERHRRLRHFVLSNTVHLDVWDQAGESTSGVSLAFPPGLMSKPIEDGLVFIRPAETPVIPSPVFRVFVISTSPELCTDTAEMALETIAKTLLGDDYVGIVEFHDGGAEVEARTFAGRHFFLYDPDSNRALEVTGRDGFLSSPDFQSIIQTVRF